MLTLKSVCSSGSSEGYQSNELNKRSSLTYSLYRIPLFPCWCLPNCYRRAYDGDRVLTCIEIATEPNNALTRRSET